MSDNRRPGAAMVHEETHAPRPTPPALGASVDAEHFNQRWREERAKDKPLDAFDAVDRQVSGRVNEFNRGADVVNEAKARLAEVDERLASAIDDFLEATEQGHTPPAELQVHIEQLNHSAIEDEARVDWMNDNGRPLEPELNLVDAFDRVDAQVDKSLSL